MARSTVSGRHSIHRGNSNDSPLRSRGFEMEEDRAEQELVMELFADGDDEEQSGIVEEEEEDSECESDIIEEEEPAMQLNFFLMFLVSILILCCAVGLVFAKRNYFLNQQQQQLYTAPECSSELRTDNVDVVDNLLVAIDECRKFSKPSVLLFLYKSTPESDVDELIENVSNYASCNLTGTEGAVDLPMWELRSSEVRADYGIIIDRYKRRLEERSVMVVRGLERVPGVAAQAFHSLCDEVSPVVEKSMFVFTMRVSRYETGISDFQLVETTLKRNWDDLDDDIFDPLLTRLTNMIIRLN